MLYWVIDNATLFQILLGSAAVVLLVAWYHDRKRAYRLSLAIIAGVAVFLFLLTLLIDTDRKKIVRALQDMVAGVEARDLERTFSHIDDKCTTQFSNKHFTKEELRARAEEAVKGGGVTKIHLWDFEFLTLDGEGAVVFFNAKPFGRWATGNEYCGCKAEMRLQPNGQWRMTMLELLKPGSTEQLDWPR
jgi:hypothetical protein